MEELKCPLCAKQYTEINPPRLLTMCGHTYCQECLRTLIKRKDYRYQIRCPEDKLKLTIDSSTPLQFPRNMILVEAMGKFKPKAGSHEEGNQFLQDCNVSLASTFRGRASMQSLRSSAFTTKRPSSEQGVCLLHQKHLDIICLQQKILICAECALFGLHKGHTFTTIRDLQSKRIGWINAISHIMEEKKVLESRHTPAEVEAEALKQIDRKKRGIEKQIDDFYTSLREAIDRSQKDTRNSVEKQMQRIRLALLEKELKISTQDKFRQWESGILETIIHLESENVMQSIDIYADLILGHRENFVSTGKTLLGEVKKEYECFWKEIEACLEYPKLSFQKDISQLMQNLANVELDRPQKSQKSILDYPPEIKAQIFSCINIEPKDGQPSQTTRFEASFIQDEVSLLDMEDHYQQHLNLSSVSLAAVSILKDQEPSETPTFTQPTQPLQNVRVFKKAKTNQLTLNKSLMNLHDNRMNSPKLKKKTQYLSRGLISSALSPPPKMTPSSPNGKDKLRKIVFKTKDPERFERILKAMQSENCDNLDFTGLQLGTEVGKQLFSKLKQNQKVRTVRLMKNFLSDQSIPLLLECLPSLDVLNLAQNLFTSKILDQLLLFARRNKLQRPKCIQLGQNNINPRKCKEKLDELKRLGILISL